MRTPSAVSSRGATLIELVIALVVFAILVGLATPAMGGTIRRVRMDRALSAVRGDLQYARMLAVRAGRQTEIHFTPTTRGACLSEYRILVLTDPPRVAKRVDLTREVPGICLAQNGTSPLSFNSRGLPRGVAARSFIVTAGAMVDTLRFSQAGRTYWRY